MPIVEIWGIPNDTNQEVLEELIDHMQHAVAGVTALQVKPEQTTVRVLQDLVQAGIGEELQGRALSIFDIPKGKPERGPKVCQDLNVAIREVLSKFALDHLPQCTCIEVLPVDLVDVARGDYTMVRIGETHD